MENKDTVTFRLAAAKKKALDRVAAGLDRDRSYVLNEAVDYYLDLHRWQVEHIKQGLAEARAGNFASDEDVAEAFTRFRRRRDKTA